jgi:DNA-binding transcriptional LysR family regulator
MVWHVWSEWLERNNFADQVVVHHGNSTGLLAAARAGLGIAALPIMLGAGLRRVLPRARPAPLTVTLVLHPETRRLAHVRAFAEHVAARFRP